MFPDHPPKSNFEREISAPETVFVSEDINRWIYVKFAPENTKNERVIVNINEDLRFLVP